jgi:3-dehydroquinate synthase
VKIPKPILVASADALCLELSGVLAGRRYLLLTDEQVSAHCLPFLSDVIADFPPLDIIEVEAGEVSKSPEVVMQLWSHLLELGVQRGDVLVCLGGGSVCDVGGFLAATFKRGIPVIFIPTTLLAMTDAAIGGKNGIDIDGVKNAVGTIRMPESILVYPGFCDSLAREEFASGYGEVVKHAILAGGPLFDEVGRQRVIPEKMKVSLLKRSIAVKYALVKTDPFEANERAKLNFGHTVGHALEAVLLAAGKPLPHGIAVAIGMQVELRLGLMLGMMEQQLEERLQLLLHTLFSWAYPVLPSWTELEVYISNDKKSGRSGIRLPIVESPGSVKLLDLRDLSKIQEAYNQGVSAQL